MREYLVDTNILSFYLKGDERLKNRLIENIEVTVIPIISYYEIMSGLLSIQAKKESMSLRNFVDLLKLSIWT